MDSENVVKTTQRGNDYTFYSNGQIIQIGDINLSSTERRTITFPKPFYDSNYAIVGTMYNDNTNAGNARLCIAHKTTTNCQAYWATGDTYNDAITWIAIR